MFKRTKVKKTDNLVYREFTLDDMQEAYEAGQDRIAWEEGFGCKEAPTFNKFIQKYKEK